jgi:Stress responsive A/B Barrel Domain
MRRRGEALKDLELEESERGNRGDMYIHTFLFQWKPGVSERDKERAAKSIGAFQGQIPGLLETSYNANQSPRSQGFTHGGVMKFRDARALEAYFTHPVHQKLVEWLMPLLKVAAELDYEM